MTTDGSAPPPLWMDPDSNFLHAFAAQHLTPRKQSNIGSDVKTWKNLRVLRQKLLWALQTIQECKYLGQELERLGAALRKTNDNDDENDDETTQSYSRARVKLQWDRRTATYDQHMAQLRHFDTFFFQNTEVLMQATRMATRVAKKAVRIHDYYNS
jgi:hypothetical protein